MIPKESDYRRELIRLNDEVSKFKTERDILLEIVEFYANKDNWYICGEPHIEVCKIDDEDFSKLEYKLTDGTTALYNTGGKKARETLKKLKD